MPLPQPMMGQPQQQQQNMQMMYVASPQQMPQVSEPQMQQPVMQQAPNQELFVKLPVFDIQKLKSTPDANQRKQDVGNAVYPAIMQVLGDVYASKITGMIINSPNVVDLEMLMSSQDYFNKLIREAYQMLQ